MARPERDAGLPRHVALGRRVHEAPGVRTQVIEACERVAEQFGVSPSVPFSGPVDTPMPDDGVGIPAERRHSLAGFPAGVVPTFSALALPVAGVAVADHHDVAVSANHLAVVADRAHARLDFHEASLPAAVVRVKSLTWMITCTGIRSARASGHTG